MDQDKITAVQAVLDRVSAYQDGTTEVMVESELRKGLDEIGADLSDEQVTQLVQAVESESGRLDAGEILA